MWTLDGIRFGIMKDIRILIGKIIGNGVIWLAECKTEE